jgi:hypothetical protein
MARSAQVSGDSSPLRQLHALPPDPGDIVLNNAFDDYLPFCSAYELLAAEYRKFPRVWPDVPLYLEIDGLLNYLYHEEGSPSRDFDKRPSRNLSKAEQRRDISTSRRDS